MSLGLVRSSGLRSAAAAASLILDGITGAVSEWDAHDSIRTLSGSNITAFSDLRAANDDLALLGGNGALEITVGGRTAAACTGDVYEPTWTMPEPATGGTLIAVLRTTSATTLQMIFGQGGTAAGTHGFSALFAAAGNITHQISDGTARTFGNVVATTANTWYIVQSGYDSANLKSKVNGGTPVVLSHGGKTTLGTAKSPRLGAGNVGGTLWPLLGDFRFAAVVNGLLSDADMATIAARLNTRYAIF